MTRSEKAHYTASQVWRLWTGVCFSFSFPESASWFFRFFYPLSWDRQHQNHKKIFVDYRICQDNSYSSRCQDVEISFGLSFQALFSASVRLQYIRSAVTFSVYGKFCSSAPVVFAAILYVLGNTLFLTDPMPEVILRWWTLQGPEYWFPVHPSLECRQDHETGNIYSRYRKVIRQPALSILVKSKLRLLNGTRSDIW